MKAHDTGDVFAEVVTPRLASRALTTSQRTIHHDLLAGPKAVDTFADSSDLARCLRADGKRQLAFGKCHTAITPDIDMIEGNRPHTNLHFACSRWRGWRSIGNDELAVGNKTKRAHS